MFGQSKALKYFGVWLDTKTTFTKHMNQVAHNQGRKNNESIKQPHVKHGGQQHLKGK